MVPVEASAKDKIGTDLGPDVLIGTGPTGKALKFTHRGSFDDLEQVYNRIDDYLASKDLTMTRVIEEYVTDQRLTPDNETVTNIYVFTE
jgi:effector-binding domain-containing protein